MCLFIQGGIGRAMPLDASDVSWCFARKTYNMEEIRQKLQQEIDSTERSISFQLYIIRNPNACLAEYDEYRHATPDEQKQLRKEQRDTALEDLCKYQTKLARLNSAKEILETVQ